MTGPCWKGKASSFVSSNPRMLRLGMPVRTRSSGAGSSSPDQPRSRMSYEPSLRGGSHGATGVPYATGVSGPTTSSLEESRSGTDGTVAQTYRTSCSPSLPRRLHRPVIGHVQSRGAGLHVPERREAGSRSMPTRRLASVRSTGCAVRRPVRTSGRPAIVGRRPCERVRTRHPATPVPGHLFGDDGSKPPQQDRRADSPPNQLATCRPLRPR